MSACLLGSAHHRAQLFLPSLTLLVLSVLSLPVDAADTIEPWQRGATDVETYVGYQGREQAHQLVYGRGITDRLSAYLSADGSVSRPVSTVHAGVFATLPRNPAARDHNARSTSSNPGPGRSRPQQF